jgi:hypothetical protein
VVENYVEYLIQVGEELTGISLEQLGYKPSPEDLSADERNGLVARRKLLINALHLVLAGVDELPITGARANP